MKSRDFEMSGPAKASLGEEVLVNKAGVYVAPLRNYTFSFFITIFMFLHEDYLFFIIIS